MDYGKEELFDVVDSNDRAIGTVSRPEAHRRRLWHRAVYVFVFNSRCELYLQQRSDSKDSEPGLWTCSASGHPQAGQSYMEAAVRETLEEIGVRVRPEPLFFMEYEAYRHHLWIFRASHEGPFRLDPDEVKAGRFIGMDELRRLAGEKPSMFSKEFMAVLECLTV